MKYLTVSLGGLLALLLAIASTSASAQGRAPVDPDFGVRPPNQRPVDPDFGVRPPNQRPVDPDFGVRPPNQRPVDPAFGVRPPVDPGYGVSAPCYKCPAPRPNYDSTEVIKQTRDVDHSRTIETQSVVPSKRLIETNHLIIRENETRNIGTVQHNHTIIEKELVLTKRNVDTKNVNTFVNLVEHKYNTERKHIVEERELPGENRDITCNCDRPVAVPLQVYGQAQPSEAYASVSKNTKTKY